MLAATLYANDGNELRFGPDEAVADDIPVSIDFGTVVPGFGFAEATITLKRPASQSSLDDSLFAGVHVYDSNGETVYRGRVAGVPRSGQSEIQLDCEGPLAHIDDDATAKAIYRDTDLSRWQGMSTQRKLNLLTSGTAKGIGDGSVGNDATTGAPSIELSATADWAAAQGPIIESWYDAGPGLTIAKIAGTWTRSSTANSTTWVWDAYSSTDDVASGVLGGTDLQSEPTASAAFTYTPSTAQRYMTLQLKYDATALSGFDGLVFLVAFSNLAVYGNHGLTIRGTEPDAGFYASDIVADALSRWAPLIDVEPNGIEQSSFVIPHLTFPEDTTARAIIEAVSIYGASGFQPPDWGYYDGFFWKTPGTYGRTWRVRRDQAVIPTDEGPSAETRCNGFKVTYTDAAGTTKSVGPPGSGADTETTDLADTDPTNPVNAAGIPHRTGTRSIGITSEDGAILIGRLLLAEANSKRTKGSAQIVGSAHDEAGNEFPAYFVRAGDYAVIEDDEDPTPRKIVSTQYSGSTVSVDFDNTSNSISALLARLDVRAAAAGF